MITAKTPGAYNKGRGGNKGYSKRINRQEVEALREQGLPWAEVAARLGVTIEAIRMQQRKWPKRA